MISYFLCLFHNNLETRHKLRCRLGLVVKQARRYAGQLVNTEVNLITSTLYMEQSHYLCTLTSVSLRKN